jgi:hypothetical protein
VILVSLVYTLLVWCEAVGYVSGMLDTARAVSGTIMPIIRSSRVMQMSAACGTWLFGLQVVGQVWSCGLCVRFELEQHPANRTHNRQLHTRPTTCKPSSQVPQAAAICITLELLMMGIMVPETC